MADRAAASETFLAAAGWAGARRRALAGDASMRRYERLDGPSGTAILMDAPPETGEDTGPFLAIARHLAGLGLSPPRILAADRARGFLLLEDLGDALFTRHLADRPQDEAALYAVAVDVLLHLQAAAPPPGLPAYDTPAMAAAAGLAVAWYRFAVTGNATDPAELTVPVAEALAVHAAAPTVLALRDYHADNLIWLPDRDGLAQVGLLDFQNAELGQPAYDLVSLLQDARRDVSDEVADAMRARFAASVGDTAVGPAYAALGAQRALRILGTFARLCLRDGKPGYVGMIPRVWGHLQANLAHPALGPLSRVVARLLPAPEVAALARITAQCGTHPKR